MKTLITGTVLPSSNGRFRPEFSSAARDRLVAENPGARSEKLYKFAKRLELALGDEFERLLPDPKGRKSNQQVALQTSFEWWILHRADFLCGHPHEGGKIRMLRIYGGENDRYTDDRG